MARPIVILAFSNSSECPLPHLREEARQLSSLFLRLQDIGHVDLRYYPETTFELLARDLKSLRKRVAVFHFGGHARLENLELNSQPFFLTHIAPLMVRYWKPSLVFLNGCSTFGMADVLIKAGVSGVVATERPVGDQAAKDFAVNFYEALAENRSVMDSFELAEALFRADGRKETNLRKPHGRDLNIPTARFSNAVQDAPWILYVGKARRKLRLKRFFERELRKNNRKVAGVFLGLLVVVGLGLGLLQAREWEPEVEVEKGNEQAEDSVVRSEKAVGSWEGGDKKEYSIQVVDQTGAKLDCELDKAYWVKNGEDEWEMGEDWGLKASLDASKDICLVHNGVYYSDPHEKFNLDEDRPVLLQIQRIVLNIDGGELETAGLPMPDSFGLKSQSGARFKIPIDNSGKSRYQDTIILPFEFDRDSIMGYWIESPYTILSEYCILDFAPEHGNIPCTVRLSFEK